MCEQRIQFSRTEKELQANWAHYVETGHLGNATWQLSINSNHTNLYSNRVHDALHSGISK